MSRRIAPLDAGFSEPGEGAGHTLRDTEPASAQRRQTWAAPAEDARSPGRTMSARGSTISEVESGSGNFSDNTTGNIPIYQSQWDAEFRQHSYSPGPIRTFTTLGALYNLLFGGMSLVGSAGDFNHAIQTQAPRMLGGVFSLLFLTIFCVTSLKGFCSRYYDQLCAAWLTSLLLKLWSSPEEIPGNLMDPWSIVVQGHSSTCTKTSRLTVLVGLCGSAQTLILNGLCSFFGQVFSNLVAVLSLRAVNACSFFALCYCAQSSLKSKWTVHGPA
jgi:hypothetical protein